MRRLLVSAVVLVGLLAGADFGLRFYSESVVARELQNGLRLSDRPDVSIDGFPFITHLMSGDFPEATLEADRVRAGGIPFRHVEVTLHQVTFAAARLIREGNGTVHAARGTGTAALTASELTAALREQGVPFDVAFKDGKVVLSDQLTSAEVDASVHARSIDLQSPAGQTVSVPLPEILPGVTFAGLRVRDGQAVLGLRFVNASFPVSD
jgi:LmeA-like phospholipid-binding